jgi:hypothetical protein
MSVRPKIGDLLLGELSHFGRHALIALPHVSSEYKAEVNEVVFSFHHLVFIYHQGHTAHEERAHPSCSL